MLFSLQALTLSQDLLLFLCVARPNNVKISPSSNIQAGLSLHVLFLLPSAKGNLSQEQKAEFYHTDVSDLHVLSNITGRASMHMHSLSR